MHTHRRQSTLCCCDLLRIKKMPINQFLCFSGTLRRIGRSGLQLFGICNKAQDAWWHHSLALQLRHTRVHYLSITSGNLIESSSQGTSNFKRHVRDFSHAFLLLIPADPCFRTRSAALVHWTCRKIRRADAAVWCGKTVRQLRPHPIEPCTLENVPASPLMHADNISPAPVSNCIKRLNSCQTLFLRWTSFPRMSQSHFWPDIGKSWKDGNWISRISEKISFLSAPCSSNWG